MNNNNLKIGVFGGSFDPVHNDHIELVKFIKTEFSFDKIIVIPTANAPHKCDLQNDLHRLEMTRLAFAHIDGVEVSDLEIKLRDTKIAYTIETLTELKKQYNNLYFIMGSDSIAYFEHWNKPYEIMDLAQLIVADRITINDAVLDIDNVITLIQENYKIATGRSYTILKSKYRGTNISSLKVRTFAELNLSLNQFVPSVVSEYIEQNNLYHKYSEIAERVKEKLTSDSKYFLKQNDKNKELARLVKESLADSNERYLHTAYTVVCALELNRIYKQDADKVFLAALLHDVAKVGNYKTKWEHAEEGAKVAKQEFGITDKDIINAIHYHTTGKRGMSLLGKIIYIADKIEESRKYAEVKTIRELAFKDINASIIMFIKNLLPRLGEYANKHTADFLISLESENKS